MTELGALRVETLIRHCLMNHHNNTKGLVRAYVRSCLTRSANYLFTPIAALSLILLAFRREEESIGELPNRRLRP